jgi:hypothetical protein
LCTYLFSCVHYTRSFPYVDQWAQIKCPIPTAGFVLWPESRRGEQREWWLTINFQQKECMEFKRIKSLPIKKMLSIKARVSWMEQLNCRCSGGCNCLWRPPAWPKSCQRLKFYKISWKATKTWWFATIENYRSWQLYRYWSI